jgi:hypothetical protein
MIEIRSFDVGSLCIARPRRFAEMAVRFFAGKALPRILRLTFRRQPRWAAIPLRIAVALRGIPGLKSIFIRFSIREDPVLFALALVVGLIPRRFFAPISVLRPLIVVARLG